MAKKIKPSDKSDTSSVNLFEQLEKLSKQPQTPETKAEISRIVGMLAEHQQKAMKQFGPELPIEVIKQKILHKFYPTKPVRPKIGPRKQKIEPKGKKLRPRK
jgi:hypothetical protein